MSTLGGGASRAGWYLDPLCIKRGEFGSFHIKSPPRQGGGEIKGGERLHKESKVCPAKRDRGVGSLRAWFAS